MNSIIRFLSARLRPMGYAALAVVPSSPRGLRRAGCLLSSVLCLALAGCASYSIPTPCGEARMNTFLKTVDVPKISVATSNATLTVEGYTGKGDAEVVTASAGAIGAIAGAAIKAAGSK